MKINKIIVIASLITLSIKSVDSSSFCSDPGDYECKHLGITKCVPKLNRSATWKPLPIEKPPCAVACLHTDSWCEERGACIGRGELCDCGPDKIYCTSKDAYSCESRKGILQSHIFNICRDGECRKNCTVVEEEGMEGCGEGQFRCGGTCLDNVEVVRFRTCNGQCISVHKTCLAQQEEDGINDSKIDKNETRFPRQEKGGINNWIYLIIFVVVAVVVLGFSLCSLKLIVKKTYLKSYATSETFPLVFVAIFLVVMGGIFLVVMGAVIYFLNADMPDTVDSVQEAIQEAANKAAMDVEEAANNAASGVEGEEVMNRPPAV